MEEKLCNCGEYAEYVLDGEYYCEDCILDELEIEAEEVVIYTNKHGMILGNSGEDWLIDILNEENEDVEEV